MNAGRHGKISGTWQARLSRLVEFPTFEQAKKFIDEDVVEAMNIVKSELSTHYWNVDIVYDKDASFATFQAEHSGDMDFIYQVRIRRYDIPTFAFHVLYAYKLAWWASCAVAHRTSLRQVWTTQSYRSKCTL